MNTDRSVRTPAAQSRVWRALTHKEEFEQWFCVEITAGRFIEGARVDMVSTLPDYKGVAIYLVVGEMTPERRLTWRWHPGVEKPGEDFSDGPMTLVVFELEEADGGTLIRVMETGFEELPADRRERARKENDRGWEYMLGALVRHLQ